MFHVPVSFEAQSMPLMLSRSSSGRFVFEHGRFFAAVSPCRHALAGRRCIEQCCNCL